MRDLCNIQYIRGPPYAMQPLELQPTISSIIIVIVAGLHGICVILIPASLCCVTRAVTSSWQTKPEAKTKLHYKCNKMKHAMIKTHGKKQQEGRKRDDRRMNHSKKIYKKIRILNAA